MTGSLFFFNQDARILEQIREGNEEALVTLYEMNRKPVTAFITRNNGTTADAEDLLQDALVVLWERVRAGKHAYQAKLTTFVFATVRRMWLRRLATKRREIPNEYDQNMADDDTPSPLETLMEKETTRLIKDALEHLGDPCKTLLLLFYWEEHSMEEIARQMGFANADTVKSKKYQCKKSLEAIVRGMVGQ